MYIAANQTPLAESFNVDKIDMLSHTHHIYRQADATKTVEKKTVDAYLSESPQKNTPSSQVFIPLQQLDWSGRRSNPLMMNPTIDSRLICSLFLYFHLHESRNLIIIRGC
jgi:hypothetical protein